MKKLAILVLDCSPRGQASTSRHLTECLLPALFDRPGRATDVTRRFLGSEPVTAISADYAESLLRPAEPRAVAEGANDRAADRAAFSASNALIEELKAADILWISTPVHNFTVPAVLKNWIDLVVRKDVTFVTTGAGKKGLLDDRPVFVAVTSGGAMFDDQAGQPDFFRPYLKAILGVIGLKDITFISATRLAGATAPLDDVARKAAEFLENMPLSKQAAQKHN